MARSIKKGPYIEPSLAKKISQAHNSGKREAIKTWSRSSVVVPDMVSLTIAVHDGRKFISVFITENMVGHALGEFAPTRTFRMHSGQRQTAKGGEQGGTSPAPAAAAKTVAPGSTSVPAAKTAANSK